MTRGPWVLSKASKPFSRDMELHDTSFGWRFINPRLDALYGTDGMGQTAENLVDLHNISRETKMHSLAEVNTRPRPPRRKDDWPKRLFR